MSWDIKLHTHVEIQVPLLSIDKHCIYLYFYSFTRKKQSLSMRETTVDNRTKSRSYTGWALVLRCVVHTQKASVCRGKGGGKNFPKLRPRALCPVPPVSHWFLSAGPSASPWYHLTVSSQLRTTSNWEKVLSAPSKRAYFRLCGIQI